MAEGVGDLFADRLARPMLIGRTADPYDDPDSLFEPKLDGERCLAYLDKGKTALYNRRGFDVTPRLPELRDIHRQARGRCILDGELVAGTGGKLDFEAVKNRLATQSSVRVALRAKQTPVSFVVFDILYWQDTPVTDRPLWQRKALLEKAFAETGRMAPARTVPGAGKAFYAAAVAHGFEGVVGKRLASAYLPGKRTREWVKVKALDEDDYVICGYETGAHVAMLVLGQVDGRGCMVYKGRVTLGLGTDAFAQIAATPRAARPPFAVPPPAGRAAGKAVWLQPRLVCTVAYTHKQAGGLMRQPRFKTLRPDKPPAEAVAQP